MSSGCVAVARGPFTATRVERTPSTLLSRPPVRASGSPEDRESFRRSSGGVPHPVGCSAHFMRTGLSRFVVVPSPSWPESLYPQQYAALSVVRPQVCATPLGGNLGRA